MKKRILVCMVFGVLMAGCSKKEESLPLYPDIEEENNRAKESFDQGEYLESLEEYMAGMEKNPTDTEAFLGMIRCQMELENYSIAATDVAELINREPGLSEAYELYLEIGERSENMWYKRTAIKLADQNHVADIMELAPEEPTVSYESGVYTDKMVLTIESADPDDEIYFSLSDPEYNLNIDWKKYEEPMVIMGGEVRLNTYLVRDGMPSREKEYTYVVNYPGVEVHFEDPLMEVVVRDKINKYGDVLTDIDCFSVTDLRVSSYDLKNLGYEEEETQVHNLIDLRNFPNLNNLYLYEQKEINDYSPIRNCTTLRSLYICYSDLEDVSFLSGLDNLKSVGLYGNEIKDISPLATCKNLSWLDVESNPITNLDTVITADNELYGMDFNPGQLQDFSVLQKRPELTSLTIRGLSEIDTETLGKLTGLNSLGLYYDWNNHDWNNRDSLSDFSFVRNLKELNYLYINGDLNDSTDLENLYGLDNLREIRLSTAYEAWYDDEDIEHLQEALPNCTISY